MPAVAPFDCEIGAGLLEDSPESLGAFRRDHGVAAPGEEKHWNGVESGWMRWLKRDHGAKKNGTGQNFGAKQKHGGGNVGSVRISDGNDLAQMTSGGLVSDEVGEFVRAPDQVVLVEDSRSDPAKESRLAIFENLSAGAEQCGAGTEKLSERNKVVFVAAGAVEEKECWRGAGVEEEVHSVQFSVFGEFSRGLMSPGTATLQD